MRKMSLSLFAVALICLSATVIPMMSASSEAEQNIVPETGDFEQLFLEKLMDRADLKEYATIPDTDMAVLYATSYQEFVSSKAASSLDFIDIYLYNVVEYLEGNEIPLSVQSNLTDTSFAVKELQTRGGVDKIISYSYGYDIYLSSETLNSINQYGGGIAGIIAAITGLGGAPGIALAVALFLLPIISDYVYSNGVVIEYRTGFPVDVFGLTIVIPYPTPKISAHSQ